MGSTSDWSEREWTTVEAFKESDYGSSKHPYRYQTYGYVHVQYSQNGQRFVTQNARRISFHGSTIKLFLHCQPGNLSDDIPDSIIEGASGINVFKGQPLNDEGKEVQVFDPLLRELGINNGLTTAHQPLMTRQLR
jgi:hypothetical protein